jgi:hypothetical protein
MSSIQATRPWCLGGRGRLDAGECVTILRETFCLIPSSDGCVLAPSPGDAVCAKGTLLTLLIAIWPWGWAGYDSARFLWLAGLPLAALARLGSGIPSGLAASTMRVSR